jgi:hypothetical protein
VAPVHEGIFFHWMAVQVAEEQNISLLLDTQDEFF